MPNQSLALPGPFPRSPATAFMACDSDAVFASQCGAVYRDASTRPRDFANAHQKRPEPILARTKDCGRDESKIQTKRWLSIIQSFTPSATNARAMRDKIACAAASMSVARPSNIKAGALMRAITQELRYVPFHFARRNDRIPSRSKDISPSTFVPSGHPLIRPVCTCAQN